MVSYTGNILGIQNQIIPFGALSIRWNKREGTTGNSLWITAIHFIHGSVEVLS